MVESQRTFWVRLVIGAFLNALYAAWAPQVWQQEPPGSVTAEQPASRPGRGEIRLAVLPRVYENDAWPVDLAGGSAGGFDTHPEAGGTVGYLTTGDQIRVRGGDRGGAGRLPRPRRDQRADATVRDPGVGAARRGGAAARWPRCLDSWTEPEVYGVPPGRSPFLQDPQGPRREEEPVVLVLGHRHPTGSRGAGLRGARACPPGVTGQTSGAALARLGRPHRHAPGGRCGDGRPGTAARRLGPWILG